MSPPRAYTSSVPWGVAIVGALMWVQGLISLLGGAFAFFERNDVDLQNHWSTSSTTIAVAGIIFVVVGVVTIALAQGLRHGSTKVRALIGLICVVNAAAGVWALIAFAGSARSDGIIQALAALAIVYILFGKPESKEFFGARK